MKNSTLDGSFMITGERSGFAVVVVVGGGGVPAVDDMAGSISSSFFVLAVTCVDAFRSPMFEVDGSSTAAAFIGVCSVDGARNAMSSCKTIRTVVSLSVSLVPSPLVSSWLASRTSSSFGATMVSSARKSSSKSVPAGLSFLVLLP